MSASLQALEPTLQAVEAQIEALSGALVAGEPVQLEVCSTQLRDLSIEFVKAVESQRGRTLPEAQVQRLRTVHTTLGVVRENLARLSAMRERQLGVLLPADATQESTYVPRVGQGPTGMGSIYHAAT